MHYRMNNSNACGHLRVHMNIVRPRGSQILSRVYLLPMVAAEGLTTVFAGMMRTSSHAAALLHTSVSRIWTPHTSLPPATSTATSSGGAGTPSTSPTLSSTPSRIDSGGGTGNTLSTEYYFR